MTDEGIIDYEYNSSENDSIKENNAGISWVCDLIKKDMLGLEDESDYEEDDEELEEGEEDEELEEGEEDEEEKND